MSLIIPQNFQHILRVMNTNVDGKRNVMFALTAIKGIGRRYANLVLKKVKSQNSQPAEALTQKFLCQGSLHMCSSGYSQRYVEPQSKIKVKFYHNTEGEFCRYFCFMDGKFDC